MNIYRISQKQNQGYDTFDSAVVVAESEEAARNTIPGWFRLRYADPSLSAWERAYAGGWCTGPEFVVVKLIGVAADGVEPGIVVESFNAG